MEKIKQLLSKDLNPSELKLVKSFEKCLEFGNLTTRQLFVLNSIYKNYFMDYEKIKKKNFSLENFK
jgi:hypothetical protein